jgi:hypothetical protein
MMNRLILSGVALIALAGCTAAQITTDTAKVAAAVTAAEQVYGIAKGEALAAAAANPGLAPTINADIAKADAANAALAAAAPLASADVATDAATLTAQANALQLVAAPAIKVVGTN